MAAEPSLRAIAHRRPSRPRRRGRGRGAIQLRTAALTDLILELRKLRVVLGDDKGLLRTRRQPVVAVDDVDLAIVRGEMIGVVGESGSGKSTLGRTILGIQRETSGEILLDGRPVGGLPPVKARRARRNIQYVYQDAGASLDPWWSIGRTLHETLTIHGGVPRADANARIDRMLRAFGLDPQILKRYPHQLSGGQLKRVSLARALVVQPDILILDEPTAGLDLTVQAAVLKLIKERHDELGVTTILITHDLSVVESICARVAIMHRGRIVEQGETAAIFAAPRADYTRQLLEAVPRLPPPAV